MNFEDLQNKRRACHSFVKGAQVPKEDLLEMARRAGMAPSGYNAQPWEFVFVQEKARLEQLSEIAYGQAHVKDASAACIVVADSFIGRNVDQLLQDWLKLGYCTEEEIPAYRNSIAKNRSLEKREKMAMRNAMMAAMTFIYAAEDMGYSTCPMMGFREHELEAFLNLPEDRRIALLILIGKSEGEALPRLPRKDPKLISFFESYPLD